jgi:CRISPR/Cas system CSM-associated protein Csm5 (group 7 of RAMP superfamily)
MKLQESYQKMAVKIKTLTPVHIATGCCLVENRDYYVDGQTIHRLHYPSLLQEIPEDSLDHSLHQIKNEGIKSLLPKPAKKIKKQQVEEDWKQALRALEVNSGDKETAQAVAIGKEEKDVEIAMPDVLNKARLYQWESNFGAEDVGGKIHEMALNNYLRSFFPGSTLKGAIRTALYLDTLSRSTQRLNRLRFTWTSNPLEADYPLQREMTGIGMRETGKDIFRQLTVRDSACRAAAETLGVFQLKILNIVTQEDNSQTLAWKKGAKNNVSSFTEGDSLFWEMIRPEAEFMSELILDKALAEMIAGLSSVEKAAFQIDVANILRSLNNFGKRIAAQELTYARAYKIDYLADFYDGLVKQCDVAMQDGKVAYVPLGSGVPWHGKTIGSLLESSSLDTIRRHFYRYMGKFVHLTCKASFHGMRLRRGQCPKCNKQIRPEKLSCIEPFPKTRHVVFVAGKPALPPGWVCIEG